jgi:hypothetical protein
LARRGEDVRLARMLLDLATDMDAEADAIDAASNPQPKSACQHGAAV